MVLAAYFFFFSSRRRHTRCSRDWSSDVCSSDLTQEIVARLRHRFPAIQGPASDDICYATQNRQEAVEQVAKDVDLILVVGSPNSSNSNRLVEVAQRRGVQAKLIDSACDIDVGWLQGIARVGL